MKNNMIIIVPVKLNCILHAVQFESWGIRSELK